MTLHLHMVGVLLIALALVHVVFPWYFRWKNELSMLSPINRQMMQVHTFFIALTVLFMGGLCLSSAHELISTTLGRRISLFLGLFWTTRWAVQFLGYSPALWKGNRFNTGVHILFILLWTYFSAVFLSVYFC